MTTPLATDLDTLLPLVSSSLSAADLSAHARRGIARLIGSDPNSLRAAAIISREIGEPHLYVREPLLDACIRDCLHGVRGLDAETVTILPDDDGADTYRSVEWIDGPSLAAARAALAPLWACGVVEHGVYPARSRGIDLDGTIRTRPRTATQATFHTIALSDKTDRIELSRELSVSARARCTAALARARAEHGLPDEIEAVPTADGFGFRHIHADQIQARIDAIVDAAVATPPEAGDP